MAKHNDNLIKQSMLRKHSESNLIKAVFRVHLTIAAYVLHTKFGFGEKRLNKFTKEFIEVLDAYNKGYVSLDDISKNLKDETGIEFIDAQ